MATKVRTDVDEDVGTQAEVRVDEGLAKLYETWQRREEANNQQLVAIITYVRENKLSKKIVKATLESRGLTPSSVSSEVSRIMSLSKPENGMILKALDAGEITVAAARKAIAKPQDRPALMPVDKLWGMLYRAAVFAVKSGRDDPTFNLKFFTTESANAWNKAQDEEEERQKELEKEEQEKTEDTAEPVEA